MSVITFWSNNNEQSGKTMSILAIATNMSIEYNKRILVISTSLNNSTLSNAFWNERKTIRGQLFGNKGDMVGLENGIEGLAKIVTSNKLNPELITDYTRVVFRDRLEILLGVKGQKRAYEDVKDKYEEVIELAREYYDYVFVDLDNDLGPIHVETILKMSDLIVECTSQRLSKVEDLYKAREERQLLKSDKTFILINRYDKKSKYTINNIARYLKINKDIYHIPYNTLFFEAAEEGQIPDFFLRLRRMKDTTDKNAAFIATIKHITERIVYRIQELQLKRR